MQVTSEVFHHTFAPALLLLFAANRLAQFPVKRDQLAINCAQCFILPLANLLFEGGEKVGVAVWGQVSYTQAPSHWRRAEELARTKPARKYPQTRFGFGTGVVIRIRILRLRHEASLLLAVNSSNYFTIYVKGNSRAMQTTVAPRHPRFGKLAAAARSIKTLTT